MNAETATVEVTRDICAPVLVHRIAALLDMDPSSLAEGDPLPRGWHVALFTASTRQSELRPDGVGGLGFTLPESDLPRVVMGGKRTRFMGNIPIGSRVLRESRVAVDQEKQGRSGRLRLLTIRHTVFVDGQPDVVLEEEQDYIMRAAESAAPADGKATPTPAQDTEPFDSSREVVFTEPMLFRYSAVTFNAHRIHYDRPFAEGIEGYPGLLVNGGLSSLFVLEMLKDIAGGAPNSFSTRNLAPLFTGRPVALRAARRESGWRLWIVEGEGKRVLEAEARVS